MTELWMDIPAWVGEYQVSDLGRVRSIKRGRTLVMHQQEWLGYKVIWLKKGKYRRKCRVNRLVAFAFLPVPADPDAIFVNHIDRDRFNNAATNLEWVTPSGNTQHWMAHDRAQAAAAEASSDMPF